MSAIIGRGDSMILFFSLACIQSFPNDRATSIVDNPKHDYDGDGIVADDCDDQNPTVGQPKFYYIDQDEDGYASEASGQEGCLDALRSNGDNFIDIDVEGGALPFDCDDSDPSLNHDDIDQDGLNACFGDCDDFNNSVQITVLVYQDLDGDGFGNQNGSIEACPSRLPEGYILGAAEGGVWDCDDSLVSVFPGAEELCDSIDNNCNDIVDEGGGENTPIWYADVDGDGFGNSSVSLSSCEPPAGYVSTKTDCDDSRSNVYPGAPEYCDAVDNDCNSVLDDTTAVDAAEWYLDSDGDGFGLTLVSVVACDQPEGYVSQLGDCDDQRQDVFPNAPEFCSGRDNDCDGLVDEGVDSDAPSDAPIWYADVDGDGHGDGLSFLQQCQAPSGYVSNGDDCNDTALSVNPSASEYCNHIDDNCDGSIDESSALDALDWYADSDGDGYGGTVLLASACAQNAPPGAVSNSDDCNDQSVDQNPAATETCNGEDDDCDGQTDEAGAQGELPFYADADGDGYGILSAPVYACQPPIGTANNTNDCNDEVALINPNAAEFCNNIDDNCDQLIDNDPIDPSIYYEDLDGDGFGYIGQSVVSCPDYNSQTNLPETPAGYAENGDDCDDLDSSISPVSIELCTLDIDENCDGDMTLGATDTTESFADIDGDGFGNLSYPIVTCGIPAGYVLDASDCNDSDASVFPYVLDQSDPSWTDEELCNGKVDRCQNDLVGDLSPPVDEQDLDGDGYVACELDVPPAAWADTSAVVTGGGDCEPLINVINPGAQEVCNGVVDSCSLNLDEDEMDMDGDGYVICDYDSITWRGDPSVIGGNDCNDLLFELYPGGAPLTSQTDCLADFNGDGFVDRSWSACPQNYPASQADFFALENGGYFYTSTPLVDIGDIDGDGLGDVAYQVNGYNYFGGRTGAIFLYLGADIAQAQPITTFLQNSVSPAQIIVGEQTSSRFGTVAKLNDIDGDGVNDFLAGAPSYTYGTEPRGKIYAFSSAQLPLDGSVYSASLALYSWLGQGDELGSPNLGVEGSFASAGDVDGDGLDDILMGESNYTSLGFFEGRAYLALSSSIHEGLHTGFIEDVDVVIEGTQFAFGIGKNVKSMGDIDGDGLDDIAIGAEGRFSFDGVYLFTGASIMGFNGLVDPSMADTILTGIGSQSVHFDAGCDFNGDEATDLIVALRHYYLETLEVYIFDGDTMLGQFNGVFETADAAFSFQFSGSGYDDVIVSCDGDLNGDGLNDILLSYSGPDSRLSAMMSSDLLNHTPTVDVSAELMHLSDSSYTVAGSFTSDLDGDGQSEILMNNLSNIYTHFMGPCEY